MLPNDLYNATEQFPGGSVEFDLCWQVETTDTDSLVMYVDPLLSSNAPSVWFSVGNPIEQTIDPNQIDVTPTSVPPSPSPTPGTENTGTSNSTLDVGRNSSRENPVPIGQTARVGDFEVTVVSAVPNANDVIGGQSVYLEPLMPGHQYYLVTLSTTYVGVATGNPSFELDYQTVGASNSSYSVFTNSCGFLTNDSFNVTEQFPGGTAEFTVCWQVESTDVDSLVMYIDSFINFNSPPVWFSIQP
jgi:hypothetical protein